MMRELDGTFLYFHKPLYRPPYNDKAPITAHVHTKFEKSYQYCHHIHDPPPPPLPLERTRSWGNLCGRVTPSDSNFLFLS